MGAAACLVVSAVSNVVSTVEALVLCVLSPQAAIENNKRSPKICLINNQGCHEKLQAIESRRGITPYVLTGRAPLPLQELICYYNQVCRRYLTIL